MNYISAREIAEKWGISQRRVAVLCAENRIKNAQMVGNMWIIPETAQKPDDARSTRYINRNVDTKTIKPFLKWAGGKSQLIKEIAEYYPFSTGVTKYAEPFVGGGAVLFDILDKYDLKEIYISDINKELINAYEVVKNNVDELINQLTEMQNTYIVMGEECRRKYYLAKRERFNSLKLKVNEIGNAEKAALMIFLNKTCFNGLYRVNKKGLFNVPIGSYKKPLICDEVNLLAVSEKLRKVDIVHGSYETASDFIDCNTFVYCDPPYRPITDTSSFTAYTENCFNDEEQIKLAGFVDLMDKRGAKIVVSNSDPKNYDQEDNFFETLYKNYKIKRVEASRMINCKGTARSKIGELIISNF